MCTLSKLAVDISPHRDASPQNRVPSEQKQQDNAVQTNPFPGRNKTEMPGKLCFYKDYLIQRLEDAMPDFLPTTKQLFEEITDKGYRGSFSTLRGFLCTLRKKVKMTRKISLHFHKDYLIKRIEDAVPNFVSTKQLLKEITAQGYRGSLRSLQEFLSTVRNKKEMLGKNPLCDYKAKIHKSMSSEIFLHFHKEYILKRVNETCPDYVPTSQLFTEITDRGYRGSLRTLQQFLSEISNKKEISKEAFLQSHKDYLMQKVAKLAPNCVSAKQLFQEMIARGYRGTYKEIEVFLMMISK